MESVYVHPSRLKKLVHGNVTFRSAFDSFLSKADYEMVKNDLGETEDVRNDSLQKLKEMLSNDKDFRYRSDDAYLLRFLRYRKFNCKEAYKCMRHFYQVREDYADIFRLPPDVESYLNIRIGNLMPYTDEEGSQVYIYKFDNWDPNKTNLSDLLRFFTFLTDILSTNPHCQITGSLVIFDFSELSINQMSQMLHPRMLRLFLKLLQDMYPWRLKRIIFFNCNAAVYTAFLGIRYLLKKKISDRITPLRSDLNKLHEYVNPALLPKEYGGLLEDSECYSYMDLPILDNVRYIEYERSFMNKRKL